MSLRHYVKVVTHGTITQVVVKSCDSFWDVVYNGQRFEFDFHIFSLHAANYNTKHRTGIENVISEPQFIVPSTIKTEH